MRRPEGGTLVSVYTTGGQLFETHDGPEAARLLETLGMKEMLAGYPKGLIP
jgi:hypothetical protein